MHAFLRVAAAAFVLSSGWCAGQDSAAKARPDVVLVTIDTLRADNVGGCFGANPSPTPNLDRLCGESVRFPQATTASPITTPSHATIMTGLYPSNHGVSDFGVPLAPSKTTLAQVLKTEGYRTAAFIGAVVLDGKSLAPGLDRGFDHFDYFPPKHGTGHWDVLERRGEVVLQHASEWLAKNQQRPRFVWLHFYDPHDPYEAPKPFAGSTRSSYDDEIAYADAQLGKLIALLKAQGRYESSLILVMSDHGEGLGEHKESTHGIFLYDSTLRIPLVIKLSGREAKALPDLRQASTADVLPTILDILQIKQTVQTDGTSLFSKVEPTQRISETDYPLRFGWAPLRAVRTAEHKYIDAPRPEFYDLKQDAAESNNIYQPWLGEVQSLRAVVADYRGRHMTTSAPSSVPTSTVDELKALGYLGNVVGATTASDLTNLPDPKDKIEVQSYIHQGMMQSERGETGPAISSFEQALKLDPGSGVVLLQLGEAELKDGRFTEAASHLAQAQKTLPDDPNVSLRLGDALYKSGKLQEAAAQLDRGLKKQPKEYGSRVMLAQAYVKLGNDAAAEDQLQAAILASPEKSDARLALARLYLGQQKKTAARDQLQRVLRNDPKNAEARKLLATIKQRATQ
jgi:arylsulfatase A-like enzyme/Tfp pilus assembly protein PilF